MTKLTPEVIMQVSGVALLIGVCSGMVPAIRAAMMEPAAAMRRVD
jgi:ABC-type antimicrobial peptide transport system permease subunit